MAKSSTASMTSQHKRKQQAKTLRQFRSIHRAMGALLFVFFFVISVSGLLLGIKKNSGDILLPKTQKGTTTDLTKWLPLEDLKEKALLVLHDSVSSELDTKLNRIDVRSEKGIVKFIFDKHYYGIQLDGATGEVLHIGKRRSDVIENIHDGSIIDNYLGTSGYFKLIYTVIMSIALLLFTLTGFWLWYGPKRMRKSRN
ncbi:PepSY-associated transmembrane protein [Leeuwenhoekiella polynyae]|uniref:PepSY-associated transmembrane protein n=2 Tax=Leeuwenhoekiella polynyae TaxID=1550906 RepID=A0A4Q0P7S7_9FLAO|nr:PepSY-associated transmembrane protein [Leeuwenhoekiella polynyae]